MIDAPRDLISSRQGRILRRQALEALGEIWNGVHGRVGYRLQVPAREELTKPIRVQPPRHRLMGQWQKVCLSVFPVKERYVRLDLGKSVEELRGMGRHDDLRTGRGVGGVFGYDRQHAWVQPDFRFVDGDQ